MPPTSQAVPIPEKLLALVDQVSVSTAHQVSALLQVFLRYQNACRARLASQTWSVDAA